MPTNQSAVTNRRYLLALIALCLFSLAYYPTILTLSERWFEFDESYGHGLLIIALFAYFFTKALRQISTPMIEYKPIAMALIIPCTLIWYFAASANISIIHQSLFPVLLLLGCFAFLGKTNTYPFILPISLLYFAIPVWDQLNNLLVNITIFQVEQLLKHSTIAAYIEGNSVQISKGSFIIADGCSGLRYLIVGSTLAYLSAFTNFTRVRDRFLLVGLGIGLALIANWIRVVSLIYIGYATDMTSPLMKEHDTFGWFVFMITFAPFFYISWRYARPPQSISEHVTTDNYPLNKPAFTAILISLFLGPALYQLSVSVTPRDFSLTPPTLERWQTTPPVITGFDIKAPTPYKSISQGYRKPTTIDLNIFAYRQEKATDKLLPYINTLYDKSRWFIQNQSTVSFRNASNSINTTTQLILEDKFSGKKVILSYWYDIGGMLTSDYRIAKLYQVPAKLLNNNHALLVTVSKNCLKNCESSLNAINNFLAESSLESNQLIKFLP